MGTHDQEITIEPLAENYSPRSTTPTTSSILTWAMMESKAKNGNEIQYEKTAT